MEANISKSSAEDLSGGEKEDSDPIIWELNSFSAGFSQELGENGSEIRKRRMLTEF